MTQELELLLKDLCGRLPYGVKGTNAHGMIVDLDHPTDYSPYMSIKNAVLKHGWKPYLFPMSSMTEEQKKEYNRRKHLIPVCHYEYGDVVEEDELWDSPWSFEYLIENHFDCNGLIPLGLAIDCTNLNIY